MLLDLEKKTRARRLLPVPLLMVLLAAGCGPNSADGPPPEGLSEGESVVLPPAPETPPEPPAPITYQVVKRESGSTVPLSAVPDEAWQSFAFGQFAIELGDADPEAAAGSDRPRAETTPLDADSVASLLDRLPAMPAGEQKSFAFRAQSLKVPKTGTDTTTKFPPEDALPAPKITVGDDPLEILRYRPDGNVTIAPKVSVTFSAPMVPLSDLGSVDAMAPPLNLEPAPPGGWQWLDTRTAQFVPSGPRLPMATRYVVQAAKGAESRNGNTLDDSFSFEFETPAPRLNNWWPTGDSVDLEPVIRLDFDQRIDPAALLPFVEAKVGKKVWPLEVVAQAGAAETSAHYRFAKKLPKDTAVAIALKKGAPSAEGPLTTTADQGWSFRTYGPLRIVRSECVAWECYPGEGTGFTVTLSNNLTDDFDGAKQVTVSPRIPNLHVEKWGQVIQVTGKTEPETTYTIKLAAEITDVFGQKLTGKRTVEHTTRGIEPYPYMNPTGAQLSVLDPSGPPGFHLMTNSIGKVEVEVWEVEPGMYATYHEDFVNRWFDWESKTRDSAQMPGTRLERHVVDVTGTIDEPKMTRIDLSEAFADKPHGHVVVNVRSLDPPQHGEEDVYNRTTQWLQRTNLGITVVSDYEDVLGWVTDLKSGTAQAGATLDMKSTSMLQTSVQTDASGIALLENLDSGSYGVLVASLGDDSAFVPRGMWSGNYASEDQALWYVVDDRNLYQPGERVAMKGWIRRMVSAKGGDTEFLKSVDKLEWTAYDPQGNELEKGELTPDAAGGFSFEFALADNVNLGYANVQIRAVMAEGKADGLWNTDYWHYYRIEEFRRPEFEVSVAPPADTALLESDVEADVSALYYSGGALPDASTNWYVSASPGAYTPPNRQDFAFGDGLPWWFHRYRPYEYTDAQHTAKTDPMGLHRLRIGLGATATPMPVVVALESSVEDVNRQMWSASGSFIAHPSELYLGMRSTKAFIKAGESLEVEAIASSVAGELVGDAAIDMTAIRMAWVFEEGQWQEKPQDAQRCSVASADDAVACTFTTSEDGGSYLVFGEVTDAAGRRNVTRVAVWVAGGQPRPNDRAQSDPIVMLPDKSAYQVGDVAKVLVVGPWAELNGVVTVARSGRVSTEHIATKGASHTIEIEITEDLVPGFDVLVSLTGEKLREVDGKPDDSLPKVPAYALSQTRLEVPPRTRTLAVQPVPRQAETAPGAPAAVDVWVRDHDNEPVADAQVALFVVDESVLALAGYTHPDPVGNFNPWRSGNTQQSDLRSLLLIEKPEEIARMMEQAQTVNGLGMSGAGRGGGGMSRKKSAPSADFAAAPEPMMAEMAKEEESMAMDDGEAMGDKDTGGDESGADGADAIAARNNFSPIAVFQPDVRTDASGRATVEFTMPDNLTRYRVIAVAAGGAKHFGLGESSITARLSLMMRPSLPRFLNYGDKAEMPVVLQNLTDSDLPVKIAARASNLELTGDAGYAVTIPARDRVEVRFPASAVKPGTAVMQMAVTSGRLADGATIEIPVWTPATTEAFAVYGQIDDGAIAQPVLAPANAVPDYGGLEISTSSTALSALTDAVLYLYHYPFSCTEQISSRVLGIVSLRDVLAEFEVEELPSDAEIDAFLASQFEELRKRQNSDGGFPWWQWDSVPYLTIHAAHAMLRAEANGIAVDASMKDNALNYLGRIDQEIDAYERRHRFTYSAGTRAALVAYALYTRSLAGEDVRKRGEQLMDKPGLDVMGLEAAGWLLAAFVRSGVTSGDDVDAILKRFRNRVEETPMAANFVTNYSDGAHVLLHSNRRTDAVILEALMEATPDDELIPKVVHGLLAHKRKGRWHNTQENAFVLVSLNKYFRTYEKVTPDFVARVWLGDQYAGEHAFEGRTTERKHIEIPMSTIIDEGAAKTETPLVIQKEGDGRLYYRLGLRYAPEDLVLEPLDRGFDVSRTYEAVEDPGDVVLNGDGTWSIKAGATVRVRLSMTAVNRRYHVALVDWLPAGLEPLNPALATTGSMSYRASQTGDDEWSWARYWYSHQNLRDERVEAFTELLWQGDYEYVYVARATTPGEFVVPPVKAEEMYSPEVFGRGKTDRVTVVPVD